MHRPSTRQPHLPIAFGQTLHQRVVAVAVLVCVVAVGAAAVLIDTRHSRMVLDQVALEGVMLIDRLSEARIAHDVQPGTHRLRVVLAQRLESLFRFDEGRFAFITLNDEVIWQSDPHLGGPPSFDSPARGDWEGIVSITHAGRPHEAYLVRRTVIGEWPVPLGESGTPGPASSPETYAVTFQVTLATAPYRRAIMAFRTSMAAVVAIALGVLVVAMYVVMRRQLQPLERVTRRVSELEAWRGQCVERRDDDPREIRTLADRINEFLQKLDDTGGWEQTVHGRLRTVLQVAEKELSPESRINQKGFMHSLSHLLSAIPLTEFKMIPEEEKEAVHADFMRVRSMIERKLHELVAGSGASERSTDVVSVAREFFTPNECGKENFLQSFMRRRHPDRSFADHHFSMRHEAEPLHARLDRNYLYELMFNLLHNAGKAADRQVRMSIAQCGEMVRIVVENDGKRFPAEGRERLMVSKDSKADERSDEGHGIGLPYVRRIARDHQGDLYLEDSDELGGARAVLELPLVDDAAGSAAGNGASNGAAQQLQPAGSSASHCRLPRMSPGYPSTPLPRRIARWCLGGAHAPVRCSFSSRYASTVVVSQLPSIPRPLRDSGGRTVVDDDARGPVSLGTECFLCPFCRDAEISLERVHDCARRWA